MVRIRKPYSRVTVGDFAHYKRPIVITLLPGDVIAMRLLRTRTSFTAPVAEVYRVMAGWHAQMAREEKRKNRRAGK